ncbi:MAG: hypothetical protein QE285_19500 [Aquabacterium sp.]|nr:hypothetical protein [Aquabacterium sp.]
MQRPNLVIVRAGDRSLHPQWLGAEARNFDIVVSHDGRHHGRYLDQYDFFHACTGSKWEGITDFLQGKEACL